MKGSILTFWMCIVVWGAYAQAPYANSQFASTQFSSQSTTIFNDSNQWDDPKKATVWALVLPGSGQIYNKRFLKAGIVYAGIGGLIYMFKYNTDSLNKYQKILSNKIDGDTTTIDLLPNRTEASIKNDRNFHRRYRDISILGFVALYALQAIDANVDAHLKEFKVNEDLSMKITPDIYSRKSGLGLYNGFTVTLKF
ncbi:DUF5683 domain-containing protein [Bacteroidia bacterium]|nr:DUF5683 domain-containing protein [Bacteroidia bacterium]